MPMTNCLTLALALALRLFCSVDDPNPYGTRFATKPRDEHAASRCHVSSVRRLAIEEISRCETSIPLAQPQTQTQTSRSSLQTPHITPVDPISLIISSPLLEKNPRSPIRSP